MTIIDKIYEIENKIEELKKTNEQDIIKIKSKSLEQQKIMQDTFAQEYNNEIKSLEEQMLERVKEYGLKIQTECENENIQLRHLFNQKKDQIFHKLCNVFWQE